MGGLSNLDLFISYNFRKIGLLSFNKTGVTLKKIKHRFNFEKISNIVQIEGTKDYLVEGGVNHKTITIFK